MAQAKLTIALGKPDVRFVALTPGTPIAGSDAMELNIDYTRMTKGQALLMIASLGRRILASPWPLI